MAYSVHNFEQGDILYASQLNEMDAQIALNEENISTGISADMLAEEYSANKTYSIGDYVIYNDELYVCIYEITAPEGWNSAHWQIANLGDGISNVKNAISELNNALNDINNAVFNFRAITIYTTASGWRLNADDGLCSSNSGYKLVKYQVTEGDYIRVETDDKFQFQNVASVPATGVSNRIGKTYQGSVSIVEVPAGAAYLIVSETANGTPNVYKGAGIDEKTGSLLTNVNQLKNGIGVCGKVDFYIPSGSSHSSSNDYLYCNIKSGESFNVTLSKSGNGTVTGNLYGVKEDGTKTSNIGGLLYIDGTKRTLSSPDNLVAVSLYVNTVSEAQTISVLVEKPDSVYDKINEMGTRITNAQASVDGVIDILGIYGKNSFTVSANTEHSSTKDKVPVNIPNGTKYYVSITADKPTNVLGELFAYTSNGSTSLGTVTLNGSRNEYTASTDIVGIGLYVGSISYEQTYTVLVEQNENIYQDLDNAKSEQTALRENVFKNSDCNFLFFTDVHGSSENVSHIVEYANKYKSKLSAVINGGDVVSQYLDDGISWYNTIVANCDIDVLMAVGNHDVWGSALYDKLTATAVYNAYIAPIASSVSNLVQPEDASTEGKCYYYKDYGTKVRVIVLNAMSGMDSVVYWDSSAKTWLESVLADAKTNGKHVLGISHCPFAENDRTVNTESSWTTYEPYFDSIVLEPEAVTAVQNFIDDGGIFVGWLAGHTHRDILMANSDGQFLFSCSTAHFTNNYFHLDGYGSSVNTDLTFDCFDLVGIDTTNKILKMSRVGWGMDSAMKKRTAISYNYGTGNFIADRG